jgi:hypothetical protein
MDRNPYRTLVWQFARPTDDVVLGLLIEVLFAERKWIKRLEKLRHPVNANFNQMLRILRSHDEPGPGLSPAPAGAI